MGISLKDIFKSDEEKLVKDRKKSAIKGLIIFALVLVALLVPTLILALRGDVDGDRRKDIAQDMQTIKNSMESRVAVIMNSNAEEEYPGIPLDEQPQTLKINNYVEEYRYGYYYIAGDTLKELAPILNLPDEKYFVNYDTGDVINVTGIKYKSKRYHSYDDIIAVYNGEEAPSDSVIIIGSVSDLEKIRQKPTGYFKLSADIDMTEYQYAEGWRPIANFNGILDGRGYTISHLTINRPNESSVGLFGSIQGNAKISNLNITNANIAGGEFTGALAGYCNGTITNVHITDTKVQGLRGSAGALFGAFGISKLSNCSVKANVNGDNNIGGVVGTLYDGTLYRISYEGNVVASANNVGGLVGLLRGGTANTSIEECVARVIANGKSNLGGLVGEINITSNTTVSVENSYAIGAIETGESNIGGMIGYIDASQGTPTIDFQKDYADVNIVVKGETSGGFIGNSNVSNSVSKVSNYCFWKKELAPGEVLNSTGQNSQGSEFQSEPKTAIEITMRREFTDWDFAKVWDIKERETSPFLRWENK